MLGKCANPACPALFRKLGSGKLFAFESVSTAKFADITSDASIKAGRTPVFFWLCEACCLIFTLKLDSTGQLTLQKVPDDKRVRIFDGHQLRRAS
jgi:hypothetical protein